MSNHLNVIIGTTTNMFDSSPQKSQNEWLNDDWKPAIQSTWAPSETYFELRRVKKRLHRQNKEVR